MAVHSIHGYKWWMFMEFHGFSVSLFDSRGAAAVASCMACIETPLEEKKKPLAKPHPLRTAEIGMYEVTCQLGRSVEALTRKL